MGEVSRGVESRESNPGSVERPRYLSTFEAFNRMSIEDVLNLNRAAETERGFQQADAQNDFIEWMFWLPSSDVPRARALFGAALTGTAGDRYGIVSFVGAEARYDPRFALMAWERLLTDPDQEVRNQAFDWVSEDLDLKGFGDPDEPNEWTSPIDGITANDALKLMCRARRTVYGYRAIDPSMPIPDIPLPDRR